MYCDVVLWEFVHALWAFVADLDATALEKHMSSQTGLQADHVSCGFPLHKPTVQCVLYSSVNL